MEDKPSMRNGGWLEAGQEGWGSNAKTEAYVVSSAAPPELSPWGTGVMRSVFPELISPGEEPGDRQRGSGPVTSRMWWLKEKVLE